MLSRGDENRYGKLLVKKSEKKTHFCFVFQGIPTEPGSCILLFVMITGSGQVEMHNFGRHYQGL